MSLESKENNMRLSKQQTVDMTTGNILGHIIRFAFPLMIGNLFQQLYNTVDSWVVGNFVSNEAFSAVGAVSPIVNMLIGAFSGFSSGAGVVISQYYGAGRHDKVQSAVHTAISATLVLSIILTAFGLLITPLALNIMDMHSSAMDEASTYLTIYFSGMIGMLVYNVGAGILRAVGDSKRPFYFLVICTVLNTILDLVFVLWFHMGVEGVAIATTLSQVISALLLIITLIRSDSCIKLDFRKLKPDWTILKKTLGIGFPSALQMAITAFSNIFVQSYINHFDLNTASPDCMSGWTAYLKIDTLLFMPIQSIALATTTFVGQNLGKNQVSRAKRGINQALLISLITTAIALIPVMIFAPHVVGFLNSKNEVVEYGTLFLRLLSPFYLLSCFNQIYASALRGAGNTRASMYIMLGSFVVFRQMYLFIMSKIYYEVIPIALSYPAGWLVCSILTMIYFHKASLSKTRVVEDN